MTRFLLIRHATNDTVGKLMAGRMPGVHLNEEGRKQATQLAVRLQSVTIHALYCSRMERTQETAAPFATEKGLQPVISDDFLELDCGDWTARTFAEAREQPWFRHFNAFRSHTRIPGGETILEAQARFIRGLEKVYAQHQNQTVAIVSHADPIKAALAFYAGIPLDLFQRIEISPASVSVLELYDEKARLLVINDTGGLKF